MNQETGRNPPRALHARLTSISVVLASGILAASILTAGSANASATLIGASGNVLVNNGEGFQPAINPMPLRAGGRSLSADGPMTLKAGDRVLVQANSKAELIYSDGCKVPLRSGQMATISKYSPCSVKACTPTATSGCTVLGTGLSTGGTLAGVAFTATLTTIAGVTQTGGTTDKGENAVKKFISP